MELKLMLDALFIKELNLSVLEFSPTVASHFLDWETELLLYSSNKYLHLFLNLAFVVQEKYPSETGIVINDNKTIFITPET